MFGHEGRGHGRPLDNAYDVVLGADGVGHSVGCHCFGCLGVPEERHWCRGCDTEISVTMDGLCGRCVARAEGGLL